MSRRYRIARAADVAVHNIAPLVVFTGFAVVASLVPVFGAQGPSDLLDIHGTGGMIPLLIGLAALLLWWPVGEWWLRGVIERWYLDGAPADEWLAHFGLEESWRTPSTSAEAFRQAHGDPVDEQWDAAAYETHQNLAASREKDGGGARSKD
ncbi:hypothetical protein [Streptomyces chrestomyceticus]|uniref:hypothetical protein n=1 Tax=Streptomyces chrestomyceticus TaxID=68185 RepID=UPI0033DD3CC4